MTWTAPREAPGVTRGPTLAGWLALARTLLAGSLLMAGTSAAATADTPFTIAVLDRQGTAVASIVDGNAVRVRIVAPQPVRNPTEIAVRLDGQAAPVGAA